MSTVTDFWPLVAATMEMTSLAPFAAELCPPWPQTVPFDSVRQYNGKK
jgi:hypothetical protein